MDYLEQIHRRFFIILVLVILFLSFIFYYNFYFRDYSLVNLETMIVKLDSIKSLKDIETLKDDFKGIILDELSKASFDYRCILDLDFAYRILSSIQDKRQLKDICFLIEDVIKIKSSKKNKFVYFLDKILNKLFGLYYRDTPFYKLKSQKDILLKKIESTEDKFTRQKLYFNLVDIYIKLNDYSKAYEVFSKGLGIDPYSKLSAVYKTKIAFFQKFENKKETSILNFEGIAKDHPELKLIFDYQKADFYEESKYFPLAIDLYNDISLKYPDEYIAYLAEFRIGYLYLYRLKDYQNALKVFDELKSKKIEFKSIKYIKDEIIPRIGICYRDLGFILLSIKKYKEALDNFSFSLEINPSDGITYIGKAIAYLWLNDKDMALELAKEAKRLLPQNYFVLANLGYIYIYLDLLDEAIQIYKKCIMLYPNSKEAHYNLGYIYTIRGDLDSALKLFKKVIQIDPFFVYAYNNLGYILWQKKLFSEAISEFKKAVQLNPKFTYSHFNLALTFVVLGRYKEAKEEFEEILKYEPDNKIVKDNLKVIESIISKQ